MNLTKKQTEEELCNFLDKKGGLNTVMEMVLNAMMYSERKAFLEESEGNKGNGYRLGRVFGYGRQIELRIPRDRESAFIPTILALFRDQESYIREVSFKMYTKGLTTRDVSDVMETIYGGSYSKSKISNISQTFYEEMSAWRDRDLDERYLALFVDGLHVKLKRGKKYANECFYIILGLKEDYTREIVSIVNFPQESSEGWRDVFLELKERGVKDIGLIVSDDLSGLDKTIGEIRPNTPHQKCIVHLQRNMSKYVRSEDKKELAADIRDILSPNDETNTIEKAIAKMIKLGQKWGKKYKSLKKYIDKKEWEPFFIYLNYSVQIRRMIYTTNWIERFNRSARRTLKIRGAFPNEESVLALITSVAKEKTESTYKYPIYSFKFDDKLNLIKS